VPPTGAEPIYPANRAFLVAEGCTLRRRAERRSARRRDGHHLRVVWGEARLGESSSPEGSKPVRVTTGEATPFGESRTTSTRTALLTRSVSQKRASTRLRFSQLSLRCASRTREHLLVIELGLVGQDVRVGARGHGEVALPDVLADPRPRTPPRCRSEIRRWRRSCGLNVGTEIRS
jgi:hypothetical protein